MTIQILHYEFLGPVKLSEWGPPMEEVVYVIMGRSEDSFKILYANQSEKTKETDFFTKNDKFKCWITHAGSEDNLYLSIYPMPDSDKDTRQKIADKTIGKYKPICNSSE
jgi:hypothetical protein